jgi:hypothetical protein
MALAMSTRPAAGAASTRRSAATPASKSVLLPVRAAASQRKVSAVAPRRAATVRASATPAGDDAIVAAANKIGLDTSEGLFGFTPFAEVSLVGLGEAGAAGGVVGGGPIGAECECLFGRR